MATRYGDHLFQCFDDSRIPPTTNALEGFFGRAKRPLRRACGTASTAGSVAQNLGADYLAAFSLVERHEHIPDRLADHSADDFTRTRAQIDAAEVETRRRRSLVRNFDKHLSRLRRGLGADTPG